MNRLDTLKRWVEEQTKAPLIGWQPLIADASVRQYYRVQCAGQRYVVMDTPVALVPVEPYLRIAQQLRAAGLVVPDIFAADLAQGFMLLSDLGDVTYQAALSLHDQRQLYLAAIEALLTMQSLDSTHLPVYDADFLRREFAICEQWYFTQHLQLPLQEEAVAVWESSITLLINQMIVQPTVFTHRDYHCRNLMWVEEQIGILDFQDAVQGPLTYDLVSLLRDAYVALPEAFILDLAVQYWQKARQQGLPVQADFADFYCAMEWSGLQRHLKILGIFARAYHRDKKDRYLADIPRVLHYVMQTTKRYRELHPLHQLLARLHQQQITAGFTF